VLSQERPRRSGVAFQINTDLVVVMMITVVVVITVMMAAHHNWRMMMAGISAVVSVSAVTRYAALFRDHYWPIGRSRSSKRGTGEKNSDGQCSTGEHQCFIHDLFSSTEGSWIQELKTTATFTWPSRTPTAPISL
jgi:hypothetical protein